MYKVIHLALVFLGVLIKCSFSQFDVPGALVEVFTPRGLRVSIPDQQGIKLFAFHGRINQEIASVSDGGTLSKDVLAPKNGRWTFEDKYVQLKLGDVLHYWTYVDYFDGTHTLGYRNEDNKFAVTKLLSKDNANTVTSVPPITDKTNVPTIDGCIKSPTVSNNNNTCSGELIFDEPFNDLHGGLWSPEIKFGGKPDYEFVIYTDKPETLEVKRGHLRIRPVFSETIFGQNFVKRELDLGNNCTGVPGSVDCFQQAASFLILPPVASAQITTKNKWSFKYGKIEIRARLPKGDWIYPELFLTPVNEDYGPGYASGQIRIAFLGGNAGTNKILMGGCILGSSRAARNYGMKSFRKDQGSWCETYHTFTAVWKPDQITLLVDGNVYGNIYAPEGGFIRESNNLNLGNVERWRSGSPFAPFDKEMYLTVGVGVGGQNFEDRSDGTKPWLNNEVKSQKKFYKARDRWLSTWTDASVLSVDSIKVWTL